MIVFVAKNKKTGRYIMPNWNTTSKLDNATFWFSKQEARENITDYEKMRDWELLPVNLTLSLMEAKSDI